MSRSPCCYKILPVALMFLCASTNRASAAPVDFNRDIQPILSDNCYMCHGPDEKQRKAKLRLDTKEGAFAKLKSGGHAIVPGKAAESALVERINSEETSEMMPPPKSGKKLTAEQRSEERRVGKECRSRC